MLALASVVKQTLVEFWKSTTHTLAPRHSQSWLWEENREKAWYHQYVTNQKWWTHLVCNVDSVLQWWQHANALYSQYSKWLNSKVGLCHGYHIMLQRHMEWHMPDIWFISLVTGLLTLASIIHGKYASRISTEYAFRYLTVIGRQQLTWTTVDRGKISLLK